jgi:hypothetical protein
MKNSTMFLLPAIGLIAIASSIQAAVIYFDPLDGSDSTLTGTAPADRTGGVGTATWSANAGGVFQADGDVVVDVGQNAAVWLPVTLEVGKIYTLSANINTTSGNGNVLNWIALSFAQSNGDNVFNAPSVAGYGTMFVRSERGAGRGQFFTGPGSAGAHPFLIGSGSQKLEIVLDASDESAANWTMTFSSNGVQVGGPLKAASGGSFANIRFVGFTRQSGAEGIVKNFELSQRSTAKITLPFGACFVEGAEIAGTLVLDEAGGRQSLRTDWTIVDLSGNQVHEGSLEKATVGNTGLPVTFCGKSLPPGYYTMTVRVAVGDQTPVERVHRFGVFSAELSARTEVPGWVGMCTQVDQLRPELKDTPYTVREMYDLCHFLGVRCAREMFLWQVFEPQVGQYNWAQMDALVAAGRESGIRIIACLSWWNPAYHRHTEYKDVPVCYSEAGRELWVNRYAKVLFERYKDDVKEWEIWNEPNAFWNEDPKKGTGFAGGIGSPSNYFDLFRRSWQAGRDVDPSLLVMPTLATSNMTDAMNRLFELGVAPFLDGMIIHSYGNHEARMEEITEVLRAHDAGEIPLYSTEVGFACETGNIADEMRQAANVVETLLATVKFPQVRGIAWFCLTDWLFPRFGLFDKNMEPKPGAMAFHTTAHLLGTPTSAENGIHGETMWFRVGRKDDRELWALWRPTGEGSVRLKAKEPGDLVVWDIAGKKQTVPSDGGVVGFEIGPSPILIEGDIELVKTAAIALIPLPGKKIKVRVDGSFQPGQEAVIKVQIPDHGFSETRPITLSEDGGGLVLAPADLPMGKQIPVEVALGGAGPDILAKRFVEVSQAFKVSEKEASALLPPEDLEGWTAGGNDQYFSAGTGDYTGADDCSAEIRFGWTDEELILWLTVTDDVFVPVDPQIPWATDGAQFALDVDHLKSRTAPFFEFQMGIGKDGAPVSWVYDHLHIKPELLAAREGNTTHFRLSAKFKEMGMTPGVGKTVGATIVVNDSDDGKRNGWIYWGKGVALEKNAAHFRDLVLAPREPSQNEE